jgi:quercetin dioxygenase-like cupin family protein
MQINDAQAGATRPGDPDHFTGEVWMDELTHPDERNWLSVLKVHFAPGARTGWHRHPAGQILHVTEGLGLIQDRDGAVRALRAGDTVVAPAGEWHWHGASPTATMTMLSVQGADAAGAVVYWGERVTDREYTG